MLWMLVSRLVASAMTCLAELIFLLPLQLRSAARMLLCRAMRKFDP